MTTSIHTFAGNIGIGTNDPGSFKLNVNGDIKADSITVNGVTNSEVPIGLIAMWYGTVASIPTGWTLCDGVEVAKTDGSGNITPPDLRTRFVRGAHQDNPAPAYPGQNGGANSVTLSEANLAPHAHTFTTSTENAPHAHTANSGTSNAPHNHGISDPTHAHTIPGYVQNMNYPPGSGIRELNPTGVVRSNVGSYAAYTGVGVQNAQAPHTHTVTVSTGQAPHAHTGTTANAGQATAVDIQPYYYVLAYIMKH
jgi:microcystin-dependent protein